MAMTDRAAETEFYFIDINEILGFFLFLKFDSFVSRIVKAFTCDDFDIFI